MFDLARVDVTFIAGTLALGGAERQLFYVVRGLLNAGAKVRVLCLTSGEFWEHQLRAAGASVTWVGQGASRVTRLRRIVEALRRDVPTIVQSHHFFTNLYAVAAARLLGLQEIGAIRNDAVFDVIVTGRLGRLSLRVPRLLAANSRAGLENAVALGVPPTRLRILRNVVDTGQFVPRNRPNDGTIRLLTVGTRPEKRVDIFLRVVQQLRRRTRVPIKAVVVGDGAGRRQAEQWASGLGLGADDVEFPGAVTSPARSYGSADIFVLTSDFEGTPNVVLEAMASGLPVVASRAGDIPEIVRHGETGFLVDPGDERSVVDNLLNLIEAPELRVQMGRMARGCVEANYGMNGLPRILSEFYSGTYS